MNMYLHWVSDRLCVFQVISAVQRHGQTQVQWSIVLDQAFHLEDVAKSSSSQVRHFVHSLPSRHHHTWIRRFIYTPTVGEFTHYCHSWPLPACQCFFDLCWLMVG